MKSILCILSLFSLSLTACVEPDHEPEEHIVVRAFEFDPGKADRGPVLVGRGLKIGLDAQIHPDELRGWTVRGAANKPLKRAQASIRGIQQPLELSSENFVIHLDDNSIEDLGSQAPIVVEAEDEDGHVVTLVVDFQLRWTDVRGSQKLSLDRAVKTSVQPEGGVLLRAFAHTDEGFSVESAFTDDDLEPDVVRDFDWHWEFQWTAAQLPYLLDFEDDRVHFVTVDSADLRYANQARLTLRAAQQTWARGPQHKNYNPPQCRSEVRFCMHHLLPSNPYGDECGNVQEILACFRQDAAR